MDYKGGLELLKQRVQGTDEEADFHVYEARLRANLKAGELYGMNPQIHSERVQVIDQLNRLSRKVVNISFNDLCLVSEYSNNGDVLFRKRHLEEALEEYQRAINIFTDLPLYKKISDVLLDLRRWNDVITICETAIESIGHAEKHKVVAQIHANKGLALYKKDQYREALSAFDEAIAKDNNSALFWQRRGEVCSKLAELEETKKSYEQAILLAAEDKKIYLHNEYANSLCGFQLFFEAIEEYRKAILQKKDFAPAYEGLQKACEALARKAREDFRRLQRG
jgi:tetratricopeptide (TPR) repeat protein